MNEIVELLKDKIPGVNVDYQASGNRLILSVHSVIFKEMNRLERQRYVKKILTPYIESGELHAVSLEVGVGDE